MVNFDNLGDNSNQEVMPPEFQDFKTENFEVKFKRTSNHSYEASIFFKGQLRRAIQECTIVLDKDEAWDIRLSELKRLPFLAYEIHADRMKTSSLMVLI